MNNTEDLSVSVQETGHDRGMSLSKNDIFKSLSRTKVFACMFVCTSRDACQNPTLQIVCH